MAVSFFLMNTADNCPHLYSIVFRCSITFVPQVQPWQMTGLDFF